MPCFYLTIKSKVTKMYIKSNINPQNKQVGDCVIRAISTALNQEWERTYIELAIQGFMMSDMPSSDSVWNEYLKSKGLTRHIVPDTCPNCYTVKQFADEHQKGKYIVFVGQHVVAVIDGNYIDTWDSGDRVPIYYWEVNNGIQ